MTRIYARGRMTLARHYPHQIIARRHRTRLFVRWLVGAGVVAGLITIVAAMPETWWAL